MMGQSSRPGGPLAFLAAPEAKFESTDHEADFNCMRVGQSAQFKKAIFQGPVDFEGAEIGAQFDARGAQFQGEGEKKLANFNFLKVGQRALFDNVIFQGPVGFVTGDIRQKFYANGAQFQGQGAENKADFTYLKVGRSAYFRFGPGGRQA